MDELRGRTWLGARGEAHPDSPAGGAGPGAARLPSALTLPQPFWTTSHPQSPAARADTLRGGPQIDSGPQFDSEGAALPLRESSPLDALVSDQTARLQDALPDAFLRQRFERHVGNVALRHRLRLARAGAPPGPSFADRLQDLVSWIDPPNLGSVGDRFMRRQKLAMAGAPASSRAIAASSRALVEHVFATALARLKERSAAADAAGQRHVRALWHEWTRRLDLYDSALRGRAGTEKQKVSQAVTPRQLAPPPPEKTWVEFLLVDQDGKPVPDVAYEVTLPGGARRTGRLNKKGQLRFDDIDPGPCQIRFPEIDGREWRPA
jgi:hypothetical protein